MTNKPKHALDEALDHLREHRQVDPSPLPKPKKGDKHDIVGRRDERGIPYPGDFPNPASDRTRGCF